MKFHIKAHVSEIFQEDTWKYYNKSSLYNGNNVKANCDIDEISEGSFPLTILDHLI